MPQDDCSPKSFGFAPRMVNPKGLTKLAVAVPILVTVTVCGLLVEPTTTLPKSSEDGERVKMMLPVPPPVPLTRSFCGLPGALSLMKAAPDRVPPEVEVKVTFIVQKPPGCKVPSQFTPPTRNGWRRHRFVMSAIHLGGALPDVGLGATLSGSRWGARLVVSRPRLCYQRPFRAYPKQCHAQNLNRPRMNNLPAGPVPTLPSLLARRPLGNGLHLFCRLHRPALFPYRN